MQLYTMYDSGQHKVCQPALTRVLLITREIKYSRQHAQPLLARVEAASCLISCQLLSGAETVSGRTAAVPQLHLTGPPWCEYENLRRLKLYKQHWFQDCVTLCGTVDHARRWWQAEPSSVTGISTTAGCGLRGAPGQTGPGLLVLSLIPLQHIACLPLGAAAAAMDACWTATNSTLCCCAKEPGEMRVALDWLAVGVRDNRMQLLLLLRG